MKSASNIASIGGTVIKVNPIAFSAFPKNVITQWKDSLNDAWADLGELIDTRNQMLEASRELHKYFHDCKDVLSRILEKQNSMSDGLGRDGATVSMLQRKHQNFLQDLSTLQS